METAFTGLHWWRKLEAQWKQAFAEVFFGHTSEPTDMELARLYEAPALRFAGPSASYPNMSFELTNLTGVEVLKNLQTLVVIFHRIETITEVRSLPNLTALFLQYNRIQRLDGIEESTGLQQLYVHGNQIATIEPVKKLINLKTLYINENLISSLEGLTEAHSDKLEMLVCKPNNGLKQRELLRVERELGIRCHG